MRGRTRGGGSRERRARPKRSSPRAVKGPARGRGRDGDRKGVGKPAERVPRKAAMALAAPVPQTDTGGQGEDPKAGGRSVVKELGKMTP